ncbi:MAG TPA: AAA family ATPase [Gemmataceae bacterium]|nr:AAA family ATPase [Gemmataceae bacterium]
MTPSPVPSTSADPNPESSPDRLFDQIASANPFIDNRSSGPSAWDIDVANIHAKQFERLVALAREAQAERRGLGVVLWGEAGIGKSHLLARFARWAEQDKNACVIYLHNLQARPENLPRALLKSVLSVLTRGQIDRFAATLLFRLANAFMREALQYDPARTYSWQDLESGYGQLLDRLSAEEPARAALVDRTVYHVVLNFFTSAYEAREGAEDGSVAGLAVRWLGGDALDPVEARRLGLPPNRPRDEPAALADDQQIKHVLAALCRLASSRRQSFVLCFDQVDNLDTAQAAALARFLAALLDSSANLLVVLSGIQATLLQWHSTKVIQDSAWDRLAQFQIALLRSSVAEGRAIVAARLQRFFQPIAPCETLSRHVQDDPLFPLGKAWTDAFLANKAEVRPRDVLTWAREGWQREQALLRQLGGPAWLERWGMGRLAESTPQSWTPQQIQGAIDSKVAQKVAEQRVQREVEPHTLPPNAANLAGLVGALLEQWLPPDHQVEYLSAPPVGRRPAYDLIVRQRGQRRGEEPRLGLLFLATASAHSTTAALRRLVQDAHPPQQIILITDERTGLPLGRVGTRHYQELHRRGHQRFQHVQITFAEYAELDALQGTVGLARSGDLEIDLPGGQPRAVRAEEVIASHERQGRYAAAPILKAISMVLATEAPPARAALSSAAS